MRKTVQPPDDLSDLGRKLWNELAPKIRDDQANLLGNLCRNHENLIDVRRAKADAIAAGSYQAMTVAKNGSLGPNAFIRIETRLLALENRMLGALAVDDDWL